VISRFRRRTGGEDGFTLVELTVAMVITMLVMSSLIIVFLGSIRGVALSKQRQAASGLATGTMEQFRALDYGTLSAGLYCSDLTGDANITISGTCGAGGTATLAPAGSSISETVKVQTGTPASGAAPIYPHISTKTLENVTYTTKAYVTVSPTTPAAFNLTVLVSWASNASRGTKTVTERSVEFSPSRCLSSATHPYSGACQAAFDADAGFANSLITVTDAGGASNISGFGSARQLQLALGSLSTTLGVEQVTKLTGKVQTTSATAISDTGSTTTGGTTGAVAADSDPSSTTGGVSTAAPTQGSVNTVSLSGTAGVLSAVPLSGGGGQLDSEVNSASHTSCQGGDAAGSALDSYQRPCTWGTRQSSGSAGKISLQLPNGAPNFTVASVGAAPAASRATVAIVPGSGGTACPTASGAGCVTAQASRSLGAISLGGLPSGSGGDSVPANWGGSLINLSGVVESAYADAGVGARSTPQFTRSAGTLTYYDATTSSVKSVNLASLAADTSVTVAPVSATYSQGDGHSVTITESATFTAGKSSYSKVTAPDTTCKTQACAATASPSSTLVAQIFYTIVQDGVQTTSFAVAVDLGACVANTSYTAAFDA
jgi:type II secretory pathway pseudopilin PulG